MIIKEKTRGDVTVVSLGGSLLGEPDVTNLRQTVYRLLQENRKKFIFDLGNLKFINSAGLGAFISACTSVRNRGGDLCLARVRDKVEAVIMITQLIKVFKIYENVERAVDRFK